MDPTVYIALFMIGGLVLFVILVSWISRYKRKERKRKLLQEFDEFAFKNHLTIDKKQTLNKNMIGLDRLNMKLVFIDNTEMPQKIHLVNLNDLADCRLIKQTHKGNEHISKISLQCIFKQKNRPELILPVYNELNDNLYEMMRLSKKASYWEKTINLFREVNLATGIM